MVRRTDSSDPFAAIAASYATCAPRSRSMLRHECRKLAAKLGVEPPVWAKLMRPKTKPNRARRKFSDREAKALRLFGSGKSYAKVAAALGCSAERASAWLDDPKPQTFKDNR